MTNYEAIMTALNAIADYMGRADERQSRIEAKLDALAGKDMSSGICEAYNARQESPQNRISDCSFVYTRRPPLKAIDGGKSMHPLADEQDDMA